MTLPMLSKFRYVSRTEDGIRPISHSTSPFADGGGGKDKAPVLAAEGPPARNLVLTGVKQRERMWMRMESVRMDWDPTMPIFASPRFLQTLSSDYGWAGAFDQDGQLRCIQPYAVLHKYGLRLVRFHAEPFGPGASDPEERQMVVNCLPHFFRNADVILPAANTALFHEYPQTTVRLTYPSIGENGVKVAPYGTIVNDLSRPEQFAKNHRQSIHRAEQAGVTVREGREYAADAHRMIHATLRRAGIPFKSAAEFDRILDALGDYIRIFVAFLQDEPQACMVSPYSLHAAYDWYSANAECCAVGSMHLVLREAMRHFRSHGVQQFNFCGVRVQAQGKQAALKDFKLRFGGAFVQGIAWRYPIHPLRSRLYSAGVRLLRGGDIVDVGE